jgi:hypothetical protein
VVLAVVLVAVAAGVPGAGLRPAALVIGHRCPLGGKTLVTVCQLLDPGADGCDALGVEAEPVHPARVTRVLNLEAATALPASTDAQLKEMMQAVVTSGTGADMSLLNR